jgi:hypothetical protein
MNHNYVCEGNSPSSTSLHQSKCIQNLCLRNATPTNTPPLEELGNIKIEYLSVKFIGEIGFGSYLL